MLGTLEAIFIMKYPSSLFVIHVFDLIQHKGWSHPFILCLPVYISTSACDTLGIHLACHSWHYITLLSCSSCQVLCQRS